MQLDLTKLNPTAWAWKVGIAVVVIAAFWILAMGYMARGQKIESLEEWQRSVILATTDATVPADKQGKRKLLKPEQIAPAIAALKRTSDSCLAASAERDRIAADAKARADNADRALANVQTILRGEFNSAEARIRALESVKRQPTPELSCQQSAADSKAAWEGWK
jgi:hypothetical protein